MPIYQFVHSGVPLTLAKRERLAKGITEIHHSETNAPEPFVRVVFELLPLGTIYTAGEIRPSVILHCGIRAGRSNDVRRRIIERCYDLISEVTKAPPDQIVVSVEEVPHSWIMEAGFFMPEPTDKAEAAWIRSLQEAFPGQYDEGGDGGGGPKSTRLSTGHGHALLELAHEMVDQAGRDGVAAVEVLGPLANLVAQQLSAAAGARDGSAHGLSGGSRHNTGTQAKGGASHVVGTTDGHRTGRRKS